MALSFVYVLFVSLALVFGIITNSLSDVGAAALEGATAAVELCLAIAGMICLWSGIMELMRRASLSDGLARLFRPILKRLFPTAGESDAAMEALSTNVSANLLGLGNAATPAGIRAATLMHRGGDTASDDLCMLVVINTASIQLIPSTVAGVRSAAGAAAPFDILPAVWFSSILSVTAGILMAKLLSKVRRRQ